MPGKTDLSELNCSLAGALDAVGDWWTLLIIRDAFLGLSRFGEFQQSLGIAKNILAARLDGLVAHGIFERDGAARPRYRLADKGQALLPALVALMQWGDAWIAKEGPPIIVTDAAGLPVAPVEVKAGGRSVGANTVQFRAGPGATARTRGFLAALSAANRAGVTL